ncbi:MAG: hypothetical protein M5R38_09850 [Candidatus Methylomirabilis sp.]|nr:hypothetical protein [Candidatus Methylomirabilis sp.]
MGGHNRTAVSDRPIEIAIALLLKERKGQVWWRNKLGGYRTHPFTVGAVAVDTVDLEQPPPVLHGLFGDRHRIDEALIHLLACHRALPPVSWDGSCCRTSWRFLRLDGGLVLHVSAPRETIRRAGPEQQSGHRP